MMSLISKKSGLYIFMTPFLASCVEVGINSRDDDTDTFQTVAICALAGNLEVVPLDVWGRDLDAQVRFDRTPDLLENVDPGPGVVLAPLGGASFSTQIVVNARDHLSASLTVSWDGEDISISDPGPNTWWAKGHDNRDFGQKSCPVKTVYIGLTHEWFAPSGSAPANSDAEVLINGEDFWSAVAGDLAETRRRVSLSTWWWESDFELVRPNGHAQMSSYSRAQNTIFSIFEDMPNADKRILINRFWGENNDWSTEINTDSDLQAAAENNGDNFEVMLQGNETSVPVYTPYTGTVEEIEFEARVAGNSRYSDRHISWNVQTSAALTLDAASWHQKLIVMDGAVAYVTGMNIKGEDWDSSNHEVFDPRRMEFDASTNEREAVEDHENWSDFEPRRDYGVRIEGPAVQDVERVFQTRWEDTINDNAQYSEAATEFELDPQADPTGTSLVQITTTIPNPDGLQAVYEAHVRAIQNAEEYIFIEDQYFRSTMINQAIIHQMETHPNLVLIVVSLEIDEYDGGAKFSYISDATFQELFGDRYLLMHLRTADLYLDEGIVWDTVDLYEQLVFNHSKLRLIDDQYISVGSTNMNNRGYLYEGEMNVEILDSSLATDLRREVFAQLVGERWDSWLSNDPENNLAVFRMAAEENAEILDWWRSWDSSLNVDEAINEINNGWWPSGFVYPLEFSSDYWWDISPDLF